MWYNRYKHIKALSVMERSMTNNVEITGTAFYAQERAREKTEDMLTNI